MNTDDLIISEPSGVFHKSICCRYWLHDLPDYFNWVLALICRHWYRNHVNLSAQFTCNIRPTRSIYQCKRCRFNQTPYQYSRLGIYFSLMIGFSEWTQNIETRYVIVDSCLDFSINSRVTPVFQNRSKSFQYTYYYLTKVVIILFSNGEMVVDNLQKYESLFVFWEKWVSYIFVLEKNW